jgi:peptidoglycan/LPS O-acetylase OafA/YrhL
MISQKKEYFPALTGIRAISAYMVYVHHFHPFPEETIGKFLYKFTKEFHVGVVIFFVLSGFLITYRYYNKPKFCLRTYLINRVARIYPAYFMLTMVSFFINPNVCIGSYRVLLLNIVFLKGFFHNYLFTGIAQAWSLTVEESYYFTAPIIMFLVRKSRWALLIIPFILLGIGFGLVYFLSPYGYYGLFDTNIFMLLYTFFGRSFEFMIGTALALVFLTDTSPIKGIKFTLIGSFMVLSVIALMVYLGALSEWGFGVFHPVGIWVNNIALPLFGIAILFYGLLKESTLLSRFLSTETMVFLGKSSYVFYLVHYGVFSHITLKFTHNMLLHFIIINVFSMLIFKFFEEPVNLFLRKKLIRQK